MVAGGIVQNKEMEVRLCVSEWGKLRLRMTALYVECLYKLERGCGASIAFLIMAPNLTM